MLLFSVLLSSLFGYGYSYTPTNIAIDSKESTVLNVDTDNNINTNTSIKSSQCIINNLDKTSYWITRTNLKHFESILYSLPTPSINQLKYESDTTHDILSFDTFTTSNGEVLSCFVQSNQSDIKCIWFSDPLLSSYYEEISINDDSFGPSSNIQISFYDNQYFVFWVNNNDNDDNAYSIRYSIIDSKGDLIETNKILITNTENGIYSNVDIIKYDNDDSFVFMIQYIYNSNIMYFVVYDYDDNNMMELYSNKYEITDYSLLSLKSILINSNIIYLYQTNTDNADNVYFNVIGANNNDNTLYENDINTEIINYIDMIELNIDNKYGFMILYQDIFMSAIYGKIYEITFTNDGITINDINELNTIKIKSNTDYNLNEICSDINNDQLSVVSNGMIDTFVLSIEDESPTNSPTVSPTDFPTDAPTNTTEAPTSAPTNTDENRRPASKTTVIIIVSSLIVVGFILVISCGLYMDKKRKRGEMYGPLN